MSMLSPTLRPFEIVAPPAPDAKGFGWAPWDLVEADGVAAAFRKFDVVGWDISSGAVRWRLTEADQIARYSSTEDAPVVRRMGCQVEHGGWNGSVSVDGRFATSLCVVSADGGLGVRRLRLGDGHVCWTVRLEDIPAPEGLLPFPIGVDPVNETCELHARGFGSTVIVSAVYSGSGPEMLTHLIGLDADAGGIVWERVVEHERPILDRASGFSGHWVQDGRLASINPGDGSIIETELGLPAGVRCDPPQMVDGDVFVPWFRKGEKGLARVRDRAVLAGFAWRDKEMPGQVTTAGGRLYWCGERMVRSLGPDAIWEYRPGFYVCGVEGVPGGPLWVLSDGAGGALDRLDPDSGELVSRFRPARRGVGSYIRVGGSEVLAISVLKTRSERSGDVMLVNMRTGETAWLGQPALLADERRPGRFLWMLNSDTLQLAALDPGVAAATGFA